LKRSHPRSKKRPGPPFVSSRWIHTIPASHSSKCMRPDPSSRSASHAATGRWHFAERIDGFGFGLAVTLTTTASSNDSNHLYPAPVSPNASRAAGGTDRCLPVAALSIDAPHPQTVAAKGHEAKPSGRHCPLLTVKRGVADPACHVLLCEADRLLCPRARPPSIAPGLSRDRQQTQAESRHRLLRVAPVPCPPQGRARTQRCGLTAGGRGGTPFSLCRRRWLFLRQVAVRSPRFSVNASRAAGGTDRCLPVAAHMTIQHPPA